MQILSHLIKTIYLGMFLVLFKSSRWPTPEANARISAAFLTLIEFFAILGIACWVDILLGTKAMSDFPKWSVFVFFLVLCIPNYHVLISKGYGARYVDEFAHFSKLKQWFLLLICAIMMIAIFLLCLYSATAHRKIFYP
jgi:hypothetical protein